MGTTKEEVMSCVSQPQSGILAHSGSHPCLLGIAQHLCPSASPQSILFPEPWVTLSEQRQRAWTFSQGLLQKEVVTAMMN